MWRTFEHVRSSPSTSTGLGTTLQSRSSTGTFPEAERPPHIDVHLERAGSLQKSEGLVGLSDDVMDMGSPRQGASDSDSD